ncbi:unnamed protein product [Peronospora farinosa]|uniref:Uncharacterized protein n=1 Tax=Peronospora farinosa TaxID=134698 RepID=A0AAV0SWG2_9STRA|nr:unnamed protein product [Peronospora farinosa]
MVVDPPNHEKGADVNERILKMLMGFEVRMERMEASQMQINENERLRGAIESGLSTSLLDLNMGSAGPLHLDALGNSPQRRQVASPAHAAHVEPLGPQYVAPEPRQRFIMQQAPQQEHQAAGPAHRVPDARQRKLTIRKLDGSELYHGLGSGFLDLGRTFLLQTTSWKGFCRLFKTKITASQSIQLFTARKDLKRSWPEHYLYLVAVSHACGGADQQVLDNIVHYASADLSTVLMAKYDNSRVDHLHQAEELAHFAQSVEVESRKGSALGRDVRSLVTPW